MFLISPGVRPNCRRRARTNVESLLNCGSMARSIRRLSRDAGEISSIKLRLSLLLQAMRKSSSRFERAMKTGAGDLKAAAKVLDRERFGIEIGCDMALDHREMQMAAASPRGGRQGCGGDMEVIIGGQRDHVDTSIIVSAVAAGRFCALPASTSDEIAA
ncbi:MAG: hypothetical protein QHD01_16735 [Bradyrhizobium sp.]|uniref:hypothetical protein n=1 Tax=Bradyrhizobium sp. TaxID=376 RepID=UPI0029BE68FE|nr:hypothetical protein [Bradyrhizobium sp.]MDX3968232.1 hypothetical protein [Bradyrhizobium sp.]